MDKASPPEFSNVIKDLRIAFSQIKSLDVPLIYKDEFISELPNIYDFIKKYRVSLVHPDLLKLLMYVIHYVNLFLHYDTELKNLVLETCVKYLSTALEIHYTFALVEGWRKLFFEVPALALIEFACYENCIGDEFKYMYLQRNPEYVRLKGYIVKMVNTLLKQVSNGKVETYLVNKCIDRVKQLDYSNEKIMAKMIEKVLSNEEIRKILITNLKPSSVVPVLLYFLAPKLQKFDVDVKKFLDIEFLVKKFKVSKVTIYKGCKILNNISNMIENILNS